jgi:hypothetical protein
LKRVLFPSLDGEDMKTILLSWSPGRAILVPQRVAVSKGTTEQDSPSSFYLYPETEVESITEMLRFLYLKRRERKKSKRYVTLPSDNFKLSLINSWIRLD